MIEKGLFQVDTREGETAFRPLFQCMSEGVALHELVHSPEGEVIDYRILEVNPAFERHTGLSAVNVRGRLASEAYGTGTAPYLVAYARVAQTGEPIQFETYFAPLRTHFEISVCPPQKGRFATIFKDISRRKLAEEEHARLAAIIRSAQDAIIGKTLDGRVRTWNEAAERMFGYSAAEMLDRPMSVVVPQEGLAELQRIQEATARGQHIKAFETIRVRKGGRRFPVSLTEFPVTNARGQVIATSTFVRDIAERKELEDQLHQAQKLEAIGQLAAGIAHEINTPAQYVGDNVRFLQDAFAAMQLACQFRDDLVEAIRAGSLTPEICERHDEALRACDYAYLLAEVPKSICDSLAGVERIGKIVRAMMEFSAPGSRERAPVDLNRAIETTVAVARNEWSPAAEIKLDLHLGLPAVIGFAGEINQAILHLITNAARAIMIAKKRNPGRPGIITIRTRPEGAYAAIQISDSGLGIPVSDRPRVFEPFFTTKEIGEGSGQGLAVVYNNIVKKHGGRVTFESEEGKGTTFILHLPIKLMEQHALGAPCQIGNDV